MTFIDDGWPGVVSDEPIFIVTDQGRTTGIGIYAYGLYRLLRSAFPGLRVLSLGYLHEENAEGIWTPAGVHRATSLWEVPFARARNNRLFKAILSRTACVHFCGVDYGIAAEFDRTISTVHDYYLRIPSVGNVRNPVVIARDLSAIWIYLTLPRRVHSSRRIVVPTDHVRKCLWSKASLRSQVIHHWIDTSRFRERPQEESRRALGLPTKKKLLLNVGTGASNKNLGLLTEIAHSLPQDYCLVKIGAPLPVDSGKVLNIPVLGHDAYPLAFNACDAYLHTSSMEGFGWPLIESMGSLLPTVALATEVSEEVLGNAGTLLPPSASARDWISTVQRLENSSFRSEIVEHARLRRRLFSEGVAKASYIETYKQAFQL